MTISTNYSKLFHYKNPFDSSEYEGLIYIYIGQGLGRILSCGARKPEQT